MYLHYTMPLFHTLLSMPALYCRTKLVPFNCTGCCPAYDLASGGYNWLRLATWKSCTSVAWL